MAVEAGSLLLHHTFGVIGLLRSNFENIQIPNFKFQIFNITTSADLLYTSLQYSTAVSY